ncbi:MAG: PKD domain-containing protein [Chitinophagaceae bacterium]
MKIFSLALSAILLFVVTACDKNETPSTGIKANFSVSGYEVPIPSTINFINTSTNATSYLWDFGDGSTSTQPSPVHTYNLDGTYQLRLTATGPSGTSNICKLVALAAPPPANKSAFSYFFDRCGGTPVGALFKSVNPLSSNVVWDFGNGLVNANRDAIVQFALPGDYTLKYSTQINGVRDTVIQIFQIQ